MISRLTPDAVLGRVGAVLEAQVALTVGLGSILAPLAVDLAGNRGALAIVGVPRPAGRAGRPTGRCAASSSGCGCATTTSPRCARSSCCASLPMTTLEDLAEPRRPHLTVPAGDDVIREGDTGDTLLRDRAGEARRVRHPPAPCATWRAGDGFGEIALLHDVERTATVRARTDLELLRDQPRPDFLIAVGGYASAASRRGGRGRGAPGPLRRLAQPPDADGRRAPAELQLAVRPRAQAGGLAQRARRCSGRRSAW